MAQKLVLTIGDISITGGAERVCVNLANALCERGFEVIILSFYKASDNLPYTLHSRVKLHIWNDFSEFILQNRAKRSFLFKIYYKNFYKFILNLKIWAHFKDIDAVIANCFTFTPFLKRKNVRYYRILHANFTRYISRNRYFDTLIALSTSELHIWQRFHKHIVVIPNFIPTIPTKCADMSKKMIVSAGRLSSEKGFLRLIDIWAAVCKYEQHNWHLCIVGGGELEAQMRGKIAQYNLQDSVIMKPFTKDMESVYMSASIYAMASHSEGFGMVLVEASSYGLPCIAFDVPTGPSDIIESNISGVLVADNDLEAYARALLALMNDENKRATMGGQAKARIKAHFSKEAIMPLWEQLLRGEQNKGKWRSKWRA